MHTVVTNADMLAPTTLRPPLMVTKSNTIIKYCAVWNTPTAALTTRATANQQRQVTFSAHNERLIFMSSVLAWDDICVVSFHIFFFFFCSNGNRTNDSAFKMRFPMPRDEKRFLGRAHKHPTQGNRTWHGGRMSRNLNVLWQVQVALSD